jgi:hypothetical protein
MFAPTATCLIKCPLLALARLLRVAVVILLERQKTDASRLNALLNDPRVPRTSRMASTSWT